MSDVYFAGASFVDDNILIPTATLIKLMTKLYEINDAIREGRMEPRIDDSIPIPPPRPPPPPPPIPRVTDEELRAMEEDARAVDAIDPLTDALSDGAGAKRAENRREILLSRLDDANRRERDGEDDAVQRFAQLELTELLRYHAAFEKLTAYLQAPERSAIVEPTVAAAKREAGVTEPATCAEQAAAHGLKVSPCSADVSIDLFRLATTPPEGVAELEWLARCEAVFLHSRITGAAAKGAFGDMFTRVLRHRVRMRYRTELTDFPRLWRVELV